MKCVKCNYELPDESIFCNMCGTKQIKQERKRKAHARANGMGTVFQRSNGKWCAQITVGRFDGRQQRKTKGGFATKKEALQHLATMHGDSEPQKEITIAQLWDTWSKLKFNQVSAGKQTQLRTAYKKIEDIQTYKLSSVTLSLLQEQVEKCDGGFYPKRDVKAILTGMYEYAELHDYCRKNLAKHIGLPKQEKSKHIAYTKEERQAMFKDFEAGNVFSGYPLLMIYTGMRPGELRSVLRQNIHLDEQYMIAGIKTAAGIDRTIPLAIKIMPVLKKLIEQPMRNDKLLAMGDKHFYANYHEMAKRCKIRDIDPDCCRHTTATTLAEEGIQPAIIQKILGHTKYSTSMIYTHISLESMLEAINKI